MRRPVTCKLRQLAISALAVVVVTKTIPSEERR
ncbi:MAG: hypothetical protein QOK28_915 [Actinomycetota bacterium]|jgi:hypothetical protein